MVCNNYHIVKNQFLASILADLLVFVQYCNVGWLAPALPLLTSDASPLVDGALTSEMMGWIGSFLPLGAIIGTLFFGFLSNYIGYKKSLLLCSIPITIAWLFIIFGTTYWHICLSRLFCGLTGGGGFACAPQFIAQIASDFARGELNSFIQISCYSGVLCGYIAGYYLTYETIPMVMIVLPLLFVCAFAFMPETPQYLLSISKIAEAENSLRFYRNCKRGDKHNESVLKDEFEKFKAIAVQNDSAEKLTFSEFVTPTALRAMLISPFLLGVSQFSGSFVISNYAVTIFKETGSTLDPNVSSIVMGIIQVFGTYTASQLMDKAGRKILLLISTACGCIALLVTGTFSFLAKQGFDVSAFSILPLVSISFFVFICSIGILPVPYVMLSEVLPQRIRRVGATICTCTVFIFQFIMLRTFPVLLATVELYGCMLLFACVSLSGLIFTIIVVRETKGKNLDILEVENK